MSSTHCFSLHPALAALLLCGACVGITDPFALPEPPEEVELPTLPTRPDRPDGLDRGRAEHHAVGGVSRSWATGALHGSWELDGTRSFAVVMRDFDDSEPATDFVLVHRPLAGTPSPGTYALRGNDQAGNFSEPSPDQFELLASISVGGVVHFCEAAGGTLTVAASAGGTIEGRYEAPAHCTDANGAERPPTTLSGTFAAAPTSAFVW